MAPGSDNNFYNSSYFIFSKIPVKPVFKLLVNTLRHICNLLSLYSVNNVLSRLLGQI